MHLFFIDESGTPPKPSQSNPRPYFILGGIVVSEDQWQPIAKELRQLCARPEYRVTSEIKWRFFGSHNNDPRNSVSHLSPQERDRFRKDIFSIITKRRSVRIILCCASVRAAYNEPHINNQSDLYHYSYKAITERFQYHLQDMSRYIGSKQLGMVVADHRGKKQDEDLRYEHTRFVDREGTFTSDYENFIESLLLSPSHHSVGIQLADMVAGAFGRKFNSHESRFSDLLEGSLRKSNAGETEGYGLIKLPKRGWR